MSEQFRHINPNNRSKLFKSGAKNPRQMMDNVRAYTPHIQADQVQRYNQSNDMLSPGGTIPLGDAINNANNTLPALNRLQLEYAPFTLVGTLTSAGAILIPRNTNRMNFYVINNNASAAQILMTFGPIPSPSPGIASPAIGFYISQGDYFTEFNNSVGINDIWVYPFQAASVSVNLLGYEGTPALLLS